MKKKGWIVVIVGAVILAVLLLIYKGRRGPGSEVKTAKPVRGKIISYLSTEGNIESKNKKDYFLSNPTKVLKVNVKVGDKVKKGNVLVELETQDLSSQLKAAELQYDSAKLQLEALKKQRTSIKNAENTQPPQGTQTLPIQGIQQSVSSIDDQIKLQENQVEIAKLNLQNIKSNISKQQRYIRADFDGIVTTLNVAEGSPTPMQMPLITIEDLNNLRVSANINQYDVLSIKEGQDAEVKFSDISVKGRVEKIDPSATKVMTATGSDTVIKAYIEITGDRGSLIPGFDVDVNIIGAVKDNVLKIPMEAIITDKEGNETLYVMENNTAKLKAIKTGVSSDTEVEVVEGITEKDRVILNPPATLKNGAVVIEKGEGNA